MPGPADLLYLGQPDPMRQLQMALAGQAQPQPGPQNAPPGAPTQLPQGGGQDQPVSPGNPPQGAPAQPAAYQSSPDMAAGYQQLASPQGNNIMSLYLQAQQRYAAEDQINRGLALIAANYAGNPQSARAIMASVGGGMNPSGMMGDLMQIYNFQYAQQQRAAFEQSLPELSQRTGLPISELRMMGPQGAASLIERQQAANLPTETVRNYTQLSGLLEKQGMPKDQAEAILQPMLMGAGSNPVYGDYIRQVTEAQRSGTLGQHPELMNGFTAWQAWMTAHATGEREAETNKQEAIKNFPLISSNLDKYIETLGDISFDPNLGDFATGNRYFDTSKFTEAGRGISQKIAGAQALAKSLATKGGALTSSTFASIGSDAEGLGNYGLTKDQYQNLVIGPQIKQALTALANSYVAAGKSAQMPGYLRPYADTTTPLEARAGAPKPNPKLKPMDDEAVAGFTSDLEKYGPKAALQHAREQGYDTSSVE